MEKKHRDQRRSDAARVPRHGSGKLDRTRRATPPARPAPPAATPPPLEQIRERLLKEHERASSALTRLGRADEHESNVGPGESPVEEGDVAQASEHRDMTFMQRERLAQRIARLNHALARLAANTYGVCEECGHPIAAARLAAAPEVARCRECQERHERAA